MLGFRVWYGRDGRMIYADPEKQDDPDFLMGPDGELLLPYANHRASEEFIPMQSTGFHATGYFASDYLYVYEGDIVKVSPKDEQEYIFLVESIPEFYCRLPKKGVPFRMKILGNKFENSELLEKING